MDYSTPSSIKDSGRRAFLAGVEKSECPIDRRSHANAIHWWGDGWDEEANKTCKGTNCTAKRGKGHSKECIEEHEKNACHWILQGAGEALEKLKT